MKAIIAIARDGELASVLVLLGGLARRRSRSQRRTRSQRLADDLLGCDRVVLVEPPVRHGRELQKGRFGLSLRQVIVDDVVERAEAMAHSLPALFQKLKLQAMFFQWFDTVCASSRMKKRVWAAIANEMIQNGMATWCA